MLLHKISEEKVEAFMNDLNERFRKHEIFIEACHFCNELHLFQVKSTSTFDGYKVDKGMCGKYDTYTIKGRWI